MKVVHKIGGSCLRAKEEYQKIQTIISAEPGLVIVSAAYGVTDELLDCLQLAAGGKEYATKLNALIKKHVQLSKHLVPQQKLAAHLNKDKEDIANLLHSIALLGAYSRQQQDWLLGYGEYWSSRIVAGLLNKPWIDAGQIICVNYFTEKVHVDWAVTQKLYNKAMKQIGTSDTVVMPGFVAHDQQGLRALLGFNGSDYTAAIMAKLSKAQHFYKWTNVDGIYTADPTLVKSAFAIPELSYKEAAELAYFGASVLHPQSVQPAIETNTLIHIKNFFKMEKPGTSISATPQHNPHPVKGLSSIAAVALINIEGTGILGVCGMSGRLLQALAKAEISVILISQASSEHSISIVVKAEHATQATDSIRYEFAFELNNQFIQNIELIEHCSIIAAVGDEMAGTPGVAAKFFEMLYAANINVLAIAQGSSERNISAVIKEEQTQRALQVVHGGFYLSPKTLAIGLIGPGGVGGELLDQIKKNRLRLKREMNVDLKVRAIMNSRHMLLNQHHKELGDWRKKFTEHAERQDLARFLNHVTSPEIPHSVIVDCTSSEAIAKNYERFLSEGCHLVTPNKKANSAAIVDYQQLKKAINTHHRHYLYETTVCAGLPIIKTIQDLIATGDQIKRIEGVVSGTLSYIFHQCGQGVSFAQSVRQAYDLGYTEPDPRDDLNGLDVARKFICLARELGYELALEDVTLLNLVPEALRTGSVAQFLKKLPEHQKEITKKINQLLKNSVALAYAGIIEDGRITVALNAYDANHPFAHIKGTDNILLIQSNRYDKQPLIIQGPGAGKDVTAAGVFADLLKLVAIL